MLRKAIGAQLLKLLKKEFRDARFSYTDLFELHFSDEINYGSKIEYHRTPYTIYISENKLFANITILFDDPELFQKVIEQVRVNLYDHS